MRHLVSGSKLNRNTAHRGALLRNMTIALIQHEQIITTLPKAVFLRPFAEKIITLGKDYIAATDPHRKLYIRRLMIARLGGKSAPAVQKIINILAERYKNRAGGYIRIIKYEIRASDAAQKAVIELVDRNENAKGSKLV